jgi:hypothetical protein
MARTGTTIRHVKVDHVAILQGVSHHEAEDGELMRPRVPP